MCHPLLMVAFAFLQAVYARCTISTECLVCVSGSRHKWQSLLLIFQGLLVLMWHLQQILNVNRLKAPQRD